MISVTISPTTLMIRLPMETVDRDSFSVMLHSFVITQNPLSFIHEKVMEPAAIAVRIYIQSINRLLPRPYSICTHDLNSYRDT